MLRQDGNLTCNESAYVSGSSEGHDNPRLSGLLVDKNIKYQTGMKIHAGR